MTTGYSPFYLLHGREMALPNSKKLKAKISKDNPDQYQQLQNLEASLKTAYTAVGQVNKNSHQNNKRLYDGQARLCKFRTGDLVYLFNPARKHGLSRKFHHNVQDPTW
jgi:hypothetical protein